MGLSLSSATKSVGKFFNNISGATSAAEQSYAYNKEFAQNAHQWEVADMEKAGLNPILSADGSGATGNVSPVSGGGQMATGLINSILDYTIMGKQNDIAQQDVDAKTALASAEKDKTEAETIEQILKNENVPKMLKAELAIKWAQKRNIDEDTELKFTKRRSETYNIDKMNWEASEHMWNALINQSEHDFVKKYGLTKDQAIEIFKSTGMIIGNLFGKPTKDTPTTSANKQDKKEPHFDKKGKK